MSPNTYSFTYTVDGEPVSFTPTAVGDTCTQFNGFADTLLEVSNLSTGSHTIVLTVGAADSVDSTFYFFGATVTLSANTSA